MKVSQINSTTFSSRTKTVSANQLKQIRELAEKINKKESVVNYNQENYCKTYINSINTSNGIYFSNRNSKNESEIILGKNKLTVNRKNGDITFVKKPLFKSIRGLLKQAEDYLEYFNKYFDDNFAVKKNIKTEYGFYDEQDGKAYVLESC